MKPQVKADADKSMSQTLNKGISDTSIRVDYTELLNAIYSAKTQENLEDAVFTYNYHKICDYVDNNMDKLDKLFLDNNGNLTVTIRTRNGNEKFNFDDIISPYNENIGTLFHCTSAEAKPLIKQNGFRMDLNSKH